MFLPAGKRSFRPLAAFVPERMETPKRDRRDRRQMRLRLMQSRGRIPRAAGHSASFLATAKTLSHPRVFGASCVARADAPGLAQDGSHPRMRVLHVEDRVVLRLLQRLGRSPKSSGASFLRVSIRKTCLRRPPTWSTTSRSVTKRACALRHLKRLAIPEQPHQLDQLDVQRHPSFGQCRHRRLHTLYIAAVIRSEKHQSRHRNPLRTLS